MSVCWNEHVIKASGGGVFCV
ncbi:unnamed protein product [Ectocarpus sp. CCAP 1310/34]|nr:unnamed protein product [Ectocarpus sp. CCAP 1310/34]